ncbi:MAG: hypothetical protein KDB03_14685 [Planctomycetales bacterium]|nr:hypothetical protein [Planctomycetales bacterium]
MEFETAIERLSFHSGTNPATDDPRWDNGFLQSLRPYSGKLNEDAWNDLLECLEAVSDHLTHAPTLDRRLMNSLWGICHLARAWGVHEDGMLMRNRLITPADRLKLDDWLCTLSDRIAMMLDTGEGTVHDPN